MTAIPNPETDAIRRFVVLPWKPKRGSSIPAYQSPSHVGWRVYDRAGYLPDKIFKTPEQRFWASDDELAESYAEAEEHRRNLNLCEYHGHNLDPAADQCITCGVEP